MQHSYPEVPAVLNYLIRLHLSDLTKHVLEQYEWNESACMQTACVTEGRSTTDVLLADGQLPFPATC